jgi:uncharacterized C2H2 Zn-finger protein
MTDGSSKHFCTLIKYPDTKLEQEVECLWCGEHIVSLGKYHKDASIQTKGVHAYYKHWKYCESAKESMYKATEAKAKEDKLGRGFTNCPCCGETMRTDKLVRHVASKHINECVRSMPISKRKDIATIRKVPIFFGNIASKTEEGGYKTVLYVCAGCKKGALCTGHKNAMLDNIGKITSEHRACAAHFEKFASYYDDESPTEYFPFLAKSFSNKATKAKTVGSSEPPAEPPKNTLITEATEETVGSTGSSIVSEDDPFNKAFINQALAVLKVSDVKKGIAELGHLADLIKAIREMNNDVDEFDSFEDMKESVESVQENIEKAKKTVNSKWVIRVADLERQIAEKDEIISTFQTTIKWSQPKNTDDDDY